MTEDGPTPEDLHQEEYLALDALDQAWYAITEERRNQDRIWGGISVRSREVTLPTWITALTEEVGEAAEAALDVHQDGAPPDALVDELVQVAALCVAILQAIALRQARGELAEGEPSEEVARARAAADEIDWSKTIEDETCVKHEDRPAVGRTVDGVYVCQSCAKDAIAEGEYDSISVGHVGGGDAPGA